MIDSFAVLNRCLFLTLVHSIWQFTVLAMIAWSVGRLFRRNVELNYAVNVAALMIGLFAVPVTFCLIGYAGLSPSNLEFENSPVVASKSVNGSTPMPFQNADAELNLPETGHVSLAANPANARILSVLELLSPWISGLYFVGVALMFTRLTWAIHRTGLLNSHARPISIDGLDDLLQSLAESWSMKVVPRIALAEQIVVPKVIGVLRSTILLPASAITGLSQVDLEMVIAHELAHVQRHDMWVNLIQRIAESVMFFNPAVWFMSCRIESLREYCCDEKACESLEAKIGDPTDQPRTRYALALLRVVELAQESNQHASSPKNDLTALAVSGRSPSELRRRVARLFGEPLKEPIQLSRGCLLFAALALLLFVGPAVWQARAESTANVEITFAEIAKPLLKTVDIQDNGDRCSPMSGLTSDAANKIQEMEIDLAPGFADPKESTKTLEQEPTLRGQVVDGAGNPLANVKVVLYGGLTTRVRGQETDTDNDGKYEFSPLNTGAMTAIDGIDYRYIGVQFIHPEYVSADGATWRDISVPATPAHEEILNLKMVSAGKAFVSTLNTGRFSSLPHGTPVIGSRINQCPNIVQRDVMRMTNETNRSPYGIGMIRNHAGRNIRVDNISAGGLHFGSKFRRGFNSVFGRPGARKRECGVQILKPLTPRLM